MKEIWKDINGYENKYQISNYGNVRSLISNQVLTCRYNHNCRYVILYDKNSKRHSLTINKLLDETFNNKSDLLQNMFNMKKIGYGNYCIDYNGNVYSLVSRKIMTPHEQKYGYKRIMLTNDRGERKKEFIHRLVALMFIENPLNLDTVDHIDNNPSNNNINNLQWLSLRDNVKKENQKNKNKKSKRIIAINTNTKVETLYNSIKEASNQLDIHPSTISNILHNRIKSCKEYCFKFVIDNKEII